eukprot:SAG22_NODE_261_length_13373_cov_17.745472_1_plen_88_part_00
MHVRARTARAPGPGPMPVASAARARATCMHWPEWQRCRIMRHAGGHGGTMSCPWVRLAACGPRCDLTPAFRAVPATALRVSGVTERH